MKIELEIDCGPTTCASAPGKFCRYVITYCFGTHFYCDLWGKEELQEDDRGWLKRCPECLAAEKKEKSES